ncbi:MAG: hypothetical protein K0S97_1353 [Chloroflexota bacterium]|jgi:hypothetical protein|nr:hypothetical protein [Chloroflexota bacterium]
MILIGPSAAEQVAVQSEPAARGGAPTEARSVDGSSEPTVGRSSRTREHIGIVTFG